MSKKLDKAVQDCVEALRDFEECLAENGRTLDDWLEERNLNDAETEEDS